jgi:uncharacterized protein (TIGR01777 family)
MGEAIPTKVAITGASGLIGTALAASLRADGDEVVRLTRRRAPGTAAREEGVSTWDPGATDGGLDPRAFSDVTAVVHLAGAGIADRRWTPARKAEIRDSRVRGTRALATGLARLDKPPATLLCGSAVGWYGDTHGHEADESMPPGAGFLADTVRDWEQAADPARSAGIRTAHMRSGLVLASSGGTLGKLVPIFRLGFGIPLGSGTQYMSWISLADEVGAIRFLLGRPDLAGPVNFTAPRPVTNSEFTAALNAALGHPTVLRLPVPALRLPASALHVPTPALQLALGEMAGELLASARVLPRVLLAAGYPFQHPDISSALAATLP